MFDFVYSVEAGEVESVTDHGDGAYTLHFKSHDVAVTVTSVRER